MLLQSFLKQIIKDYQKGEEVTLNTYRLDFSDYPLNTLGNYNRIVNWQSTNSVITFEYTVYSLMLSKEVTVKLQFDKQDGDELNDGYLTSVQIRLDEENVIFSSDTENGTHAWLNLIKQDAIDFISLEFLYDNRTGLEVNHEFGEISKDEYNKEIENYDKIKKEFDENRRKEVYSYYATTREKDTIFKKNNLDTRILDWTLENKSFFCIPLVEYLSNMDKQETHDYVMSMLASSKDEDFIFAVNKVMDDFMASEADNMKDYSFRLESLFLEQQTKKSEHSLHINNTQYPENSFRLNIQQDYIFELGKVNWLPVELFEIDGSVSNQNISEDEEKLKRQQEYEQNQAKAVDFDMFYEVIMSLNHIFKPEEDIFYKSHKDFMDNVRYSHKMQRALEEFLNRFILEVLTPDWADKMAYVSSSRIEDVKRVYSLDNHDHFTKLLRRYFEALRLFRQTHDEEGKSTYTFHENRYGLDYKPGSFIQKWINRLGIGDDLRIVPINDGLGVQLRICRNGDTEGTLLAYEGYGMTQLVSLLLEIETAILTAQGRFVKGIFGMPTEQFKGYETRTICIEEPEIHLHPRLQSYLADMFCEAYGKYNVHFVIETHSEYLIRRLQLLASDKCEEHNINRKDVSIAYVYDADIEKRPLGEPHIKHIGICKDGYLDDTFGSGFFDEATSLSRQLF